MPPRISLTKAASPAIACRHNVNSHWTVASFLLPLLQRQQQSPSSQIRCASILSSLSDNSGAYNKKIRRGRGPSSGKGKTSGRGHKGQKQHGKVPKGFQGGQTPLEVVHGTRGFKNNFSVHMSPLNIDRLQSWIDAGRIDPSRPITMRELNNSRCLHGIKDGVKLLARGANTSLSSPLSSSDKSTTPGLRTSINIVVSRASAAAISAVEAAGGTVTTRYYSKPAIGMVMKGLSHPFKSLQTKSLAFEDSPSPSPTSTPGSTAALLGPAQGYKYRLPDPTSRKDIEYYRDPAHRGYLSWMVGEGQGPSLFFKTPGEGRVDASKVGSKRGKSLAKGENRIW